ncbi:MAG: hypothetical protein IT168_06830 [Bryobacterales bacterium]|nr:hypothetical protein [Bryobacterales bacterium]
MTPTATNNGAERQYACSICGEPSTRICHHCTKDACGNHLCEKCNFCSDCCRCEVPLVESNGAEMDLPS